MPGTTFYFKFQPRADYKCDYVNKVGCWHLRIGALASPQESVRPYKMLAYDLADTTLQGVSNFETVYSFPITEKVSYFDLGYLNPPSCRDWPTSDNVDMLVTDVADWSHVLYQINVKEGLN